MAVKKKAVAKKTAAKKTATKKAAATNVEFSNAAEADTPVVAKKRAAAKKKTSAKKTASKAVGGQGLPREMGEHGFVIGSDSAKIAEVLLEGGESRTDVSLKVEKALGKKKTRHGNDPNVSSLIANVLRRMKERGYTIEQSWVLREPTPASKAAATKAANKAAAEKGNKPTAKKAVAAKKTAKKRPAKKAAA